MKNKNLYIIGFTLGLTTLLAVCTYLLTERNSVRAHEAPLAETHNYYNNVLAIPPLPDELYFAGEKVPLENYWVREALDRELTAICYHHSTTLLCLKRAGRYFPTIEKILDEEKMHADFKYLCVAESGLANVVSPAKAAGFWQFLSATGKTYGLEINAEVDERYHLEKSTRAACRYLKNAKGQLGSWALAAAAYNMGEAGVRNQMNLQSLNNYWDLYLNSETARYLYRILAYKLVFENPHIYGVHISNEQKYQPINSKEVTVSTTIPDLYNFCQKHNITYRELKELNPWLRSTKLTVINNTYSIKIPTK